VFGRSAYQGRRFIKAKLQENLVAKSMTVSELASAHPVAGHAACGGQLGGGGEEERDVGQEAGKSEQDHGQACRFRCRRGCSTRGVEIARRPEDIGGQTGAACERVRLPR